MNEDFLYYLWKYHLPGKTMMGSKKETIFIKHPGQQNADSGPDFFNGNINIERCGQGISRYTPNLPTGTATDIKTTCTTTTLFCMWFMKMTGLYAGKAERTYSHAAAER